MKQIKFIPALIIGSLFTQAILNDLAYCKIPSEVDAGKYRSDSNNQILQPNSGIKIKDNTGSNKKRISPTIAKDIEFFLNKVEILGMRALDPKKVSKIYKSRLNTTIKLSKLYEFCEKITEMYNNKGYFLSLAYVPQQKIDKDAGVVKIQVIEGFIRDIRLPENTKKYNPKIYNLLQNILLTKPIDIQTLQTGLLRINDLFGYKFAGTLVNVDSNSDGGVILVVDANQAKDHPRIAVNNFSSNSIGPHKIKFNYNYAISPFNQISLMQENAFIGSLKRFNYFNLGETIIINKYSDLSIIGDTTKMMPEDLGNPIKSRSSSVNLGLNFKLIRERIRNLNLRWGFSFKNAYNYIMGIMSYKDKIRSLKFNLNYYSVNLDTTYLLDFGVTKGLNVLSTKNHGGVPSSRAGAKNNFHKFEANASYVRRFLDNFAIQVVLNAQYANGTMFASEEFGYGGSSMGKAFGSSEVSGDKGVSGMLEFSYNGWSNSSAVNLIPYIYIDQGVVWKKDPNSKTKQSGSSYGLGFRYYLNNFNAHFGLAWPRVRRISSPIYGFGAKAPRILLEVAVVL